MEAKRHIEPHQATFLMVGCKKDLARTEREVPKETAQVVNTKIFIISMYCSQVGPHLGTLVPMGTNVSFLVPIFFQSPHFLHFRPKNASKVSAATI